MKDNDYHRSLFALKHKLEAVMQERDQLRSEVESLKRDKERLDWCERHLLELSDGGGAYIIKFGPVDKPKVLGDIEELGTVRSAIDAAMKEGK